METFLGNVAEFVLRHQQDDDRVCIVLPGRRAGLFLKKEIASRITNPIWSPEIISIEDLFLRLSGLEKIDDAELLLSLYEIVRKTPGHTEEPFDGFCKWAPALLLDFNDVDAWLADPRQLFKNLSEIKEIEHWSLGEEKLTDFQKKYLLFWDQIAGWYKELREITLRSGKAWSGLIYRTVAENIIPLIEKSPWNHFVFAGFNALNTSEIKLFESLSSSGKADILWDTDRYYIEDTINEAGKFLRKYKDSLFKNDARRGREFANITDHFATQAKDITLIAAARNVSQARAVSGYLEREGKDFNPAETAVILADEQLLMPVLNAIPTRFTDVNITMGYPLKNTPVFTLLHILFSLQENAGHFKIKARDGHLKFYHHDVIRLFRHPYIIACTHKPERLLKCIQEIAKGNHTFVSLPQLIGFITDKAELGIESLFTPWENTSTAIEGILMFIDKMRNTFALNPNDHSLDTEYVYQLHLSVNKVSNLLSRWPNFTEISALKNILIQTFGAGSVPFSGEPLQGLQIMGMLETRALDFKNIIIVSANEGIIPGASNRHSFIMHDLRHAFGLPMYNDREAVSGYHFYRALQRAENICLIYNTDQDAFGAKEKSRFITQLTYELPKVNKLASFHSIVAGAELNATQFSDAITIPSSEEVVKIILKKAEVGFSPSMVNTFRECKLQFYFRYVCGLYDLDEVEESADANSLGTIIHRMLELLFTPYRNKILTTDAVSAMKSLIPTVCREAFKENFTWEGEQDGKNLLAGNMARRYVSKYLDLEIERIKENTGQNILTTVVALEEDLIAKAVVDGHEIIFKGTADKIERIGGKVRITDYKTGQVDQKDITLKDWSDFSDSTKKGKAFQLMLYAWMYLKNAPEGEVVQPGIISFRKLKNGFINLQTPQGEYITSSNLNDFEDTLFAITKQLISTTTNFDQTANAQSCSICAFKSICRRESTY